jgi:hypothetical protein
MPLRFRRSISFGPGLRLNLAKRGASLSVGRRGATVNVNRRGTRTTVGVPRTGMSYSSSTAPARRTRKSKEGGIGSTLVGLAVLAGLLVVLFHWLAG